MSLWRNKGGKEMILPIDLLLLLFLLIIAVAALWVKDLLAAIVLMGAYSFIMANVWLQMGS
ncbi:hydrogenase subunit MbhD domain-containing protein, partial [Methanothrix soehngenii]